MVLSISKGFFSCRYPNSINTSCRLIPILVFAYATAISISNTIPTIFLKIPTSAYTRALISCYCITISIDLSALLGIGSRFTGMRIVGHGCCVYIDREFLPTLHCLYSM